MNIKKEKKKKMKNLKKNEFSQLYHDFLKSKIKEYCNENNCYEVYWGYKEGIEPSSLLEAYKTYKENGFERIEDYLENQLLDMNYDYDINLISQIQSDLKYEDFYTNEFENWYKNNNDNIYEDLCENGYKGIDINLKELLNNSNYHFNVMFATDEEQNYDMGSIVTAFGTYHEPYYKYLEKENFDNALTYLIHQQGHSCKEYFDELKGYPNGYTKSYSCKFIESIVNDVVNNTSEAMSELTVLVNMDGNEAIKFLNYLGDKENNSNLKIDKNCEIGIFNEWSGCGGLLEIALEKDFIVPKNMIRGFQIEGCKNQSYTVDEVYGLINSCWKPCLDYTEEIPELVNENIDETIKYTQEICKEEVEMGEE